MTKISMITTSVFDREYKRLKKKYKSLTSDIALLEYELLKNPELGISLGNNFRKIRVSIKSKGKGKSGGARVITLNMIASVNERTVLLVIIWDKSELESISDAHIKKIMKGLNF